ncbi:MAG: hypothetical protein IJL32_16420 [Oscillospiraceae bacterium]|nr:hypothetical protein [Oscillospiraceae bacterium]
MSDFTLCEQCGKEPAAVFLGTKDGDAKKRRSLCLNCAKESGIPEVQEYLRRKNAQQIGSQKCVQCGKLPAVVFVSKYSGGEAEREGLCLFCAREQKIPQVTEYLARMNVSDDELRKLHEDLQAQKPDGLIRKIGQLFKS